MAFCRMCGNQIDEKAAFCPACGAAQSVQNAQPAAPEVENPRPIYADPGYTAPAAPAAEVDNGGFWWGALGCCVPIVGLILFLVWKDTKPRTARALGKGALVYAICLVVYIVVCFVLGVGIGLAGY